MSYNQENNLFNAEQGGKAFSIMMATYVLIAFFVQTLLLCFTSETSFLYIAVCSIISSLSTFVALLYINKTQKIRFKELSVKRLSATSVLMAILLATGMFLGLGFVNISLIQVLSDLGVNLNSPTVNLDSIWHLLYFTITLAVLPAIFEELFFRGLFLSSLNSQNNLTKTLIVGLFFALYHCNLGQFVYQFIYGMALCLITIYAKSILPAILTHFLNNFVVILFTYLRIEINLFSPILIAFGLLCLALFLAVAICKLKKESGEKIKQDKKGFVKATFIPYGIFGVIICAVMLVSALFV